MPTINQPPIVWLVLRARAVLKTPNYKAGGFWGAKFKLGPLVVVRQGGHVGFYKILLMFF